MKAEHILLLVLAGAVVGAGLMKVVQKPQMAANTAVKTEPLALPPVPASPEPMAPAPVTAAPAAVPAAPEQTAVAAVEPTEKPQAVARDRTLDPPMFPVSRLRACRRSPPSLRPSFAVHQ